MNDSFLADFAVRMARREADMAAVCELRDTLELAMAVDAPEHESERIRRGVRDLMAMCDEALTVYAVYCRCPTGPWSPQIVHGDRWRARCEGCGREISADTHDALIDTWNAEVGPAGEDDAE